MICIIILGLPVIYHPMNFLPFDVHCCVHNSLLVHFIVTPQRIPRLCSFDVNMVFWVHMLWGFSRHCATVYDTCLLQYKT